MQKGIVILNHNMNSKKEKKPIWLQNHFCSLMFCVLKDKVHKHQGCFVYIAMIVVFSFLFNIARFFELKTETRYYHQTYNETEEKNSTDLQTVTETYEVICEWRGNIHL